ncbi:hypothetical protein QR680_001832 [Steinernema hermaphroditum]|uniref:Kinesin motor domain-containing protein n=1 Tax=Steinernema hermaphroditum TaxID=289476 RepID=A0AA39H246_9BILA|nr:hypothetical protein QR680_001832 [Steinernema hermaphroditum]
MSTPSRLPKLAHARRVVRRSISIQSAGIAKQVLSKVQGKRTPTSGQKESSEANAALATPSVRKPLSASNHTASSRATTSTSLKRPLVTASLPRGVPSCKISRTVQQTPASINQSKELESKYKETVFENDQLKLKIASYEIQLKTLQETLALQTAQLSQKNESLLQLTTQLATASAQATNSDLKSKLLEAEIETLQGTIKSQSEQLNAKNDIISQLSTQLTTVSSQLTISESQHKATSALYQKSLVEIDDLRSQNSRLLNEAKEAEIAHKKEILSCNDRIRLLLNEVVDLRGRIRVVVRLRPFLPEESSSTSVSHLGFPDLRSISVKANNKSSTYQFQHVFGCSSSQQNVFGEVKELVESVLHGYNVAIIAYGQTGSGKTFTMRGGEGEQAGIIPRAIEFMFETKKKLTHLEWRYDYSASFLEVYNDEVFDLLADDKTKLKVSVGSGQVEIPCLKSLDLSCPEDLYELLAVSDKNRSTASTKMNSSSSRSHAVFLLKVTATNTMTNQSFSSLLSMVDLAGSERAKESEVEGARFTEMTHINKALSNLQNVIRALLKKEQHVPYRNSKLTLLLQECLGKGNSKTLMIVNLRPSGSHIAETKRSLEFAQNTSKTTIGAAVKTETH